jgi:hypothetical protein
MKTMGDPSGAANLSLVSMSAYWPGKREGSVMLPVAETSTPNGSEPNGDLGENLKICPPPR